MEHIIGILLYDSFIELPGSNQRFEEKQGHFQLPRARQAGRKEHATKCVTSEDLRKSLRENQKKIMYLYQIAPHERHFCLFALEYR